MESTANLVKSKASNLRLKV